LADPADPGRFHDRLNARINAAGPFFVSPTALRGRTTLRVTIGNLRTGREHIEALWKTITEEAEVLRREDGEGYS
jgi:aromatic-L-amino-acid decarboxylase